MTASLELGRVSGNFVEIPASQLLSFAGNPVFPQSGGPGTLDTGSVDMTLFRRAIFTVIVGVPGGSATIDLKIQVSTDNASFTDLITVNPSATNTSIGQINQTNRVRSLEIDSSHMPATYRYVRARITVGVAASLVCGFALGMGSCLTSSGNLSGNDVAAVNQRSVVGP